MTRRPWLLPAVILATTAVAAAIVLAAGGPDSGTVATLLLVGVPFMVVIGGASDYGLRAAPSPYGPTPPGPRRLRLMALLPAMLTQLVAAAVIAWQATAAAAAGDPVCAVALIPPAMVLGWRAWEIARRIGPGPTDPRPDQQGPRS